MREHGLCLFSFNIWSWLCWWVVGDFFFLPALHDPGRFLVNPSSGSKVADKPTFSKHRKSTAATSGNHEENPSETKKKKNIHKILNDREGKSGYPTYIFPSLLPWETVKVKNRLYPFKQEALFYYESANPCIYSKGICVRMLNSNPLLD